MPIHLGGTPAGQFSHVLLFSPQPQPQVTTIQLKPGGRSSPHPLQIFEFEYVSRESALTLTSVVDIFE